MLFVNLLAGNRELAIATRNRKQLEVTRQLHRSASAALKFSRWKLLKKSCREVTLFRLDEENIDAVSCQHTSSFNALHRLPLDAQQKLVLDTIREAVAQLQLGPNTAELARTLIEENVTQTELAKSLGVTRQAVNQRV